MLQKKFVTSIQTPLTSFSEQGAQQVETPSHAISKFGVFKYFNHLKLIGCAIGLLVTTLGFSVWFALISLDKFHIRASLDMIVPIGIELKHSIETGLKYGIKIDELIDIDLKIRNAEHILNYILNSKTDQPTNQNQSIVFVVNASYELLYGSPLSFQKVGFNPDVISDANDTITINNNIRVIDSKTYYNLLVPVHNDSKQIIAYIAILTESGCMKNLSDYSKTFVICTMSILSIISSLTLIILIPKLLQKGPTITDDIKRRISKTIFVAICCAQLIFFTFSISQLYLDSYRINREKTKIILSLLADRFDQYLRANIDLSMIADLDSLLNKIQMRYPEISSITLIPMTQREKSDVLKDERKEILRNNSFNKTDSLLGSHFQVFSIFYMLFDEDNKCHGTLLGHLSKSFLFKKIQEFALDFLTVIVVTILLVVELLILLFKILLTTKNSVSNNNTIHYSFMRPAAFLFLFGIDISMSFLPLHAENLYSSFWGLSKDTVMGLPISIEFLCVGISIFISGFWNDRRGWHEPFLTGLFLAASGGIYSWIAPDILHFIISRALVGIGYGFMLLAAQGFVIDYTDETNRAQGLAQFLAGLYAGSICGGATGALLAEHFGYRSVFLFGAIMLYGVMIYVFVFLRRAMLKPSCRHVNEDMDMISQAKWKPFFKNKIVIALIFFSSLPAAIAVVGFLNYFSPIYLDSIGASQGTIGRVLMIYGISLIYLGPIISRHVDASCDKKRYIFIGCLLGSITFLIFNFFSGLFAAVLAVFLLGLSSSFVIASQGAYLLNLHVTQRLGAGKAIGVFRATSRVGQALGPLVFSLLTISTNIGKDITQLGLLYLLTAFLFLLITYRDKFEFQRSLL